MFHVLHRFAETGPGTVTLGGGRNIDSSVRQRNLSFRQSNKFHGLLGSDRRHESVRIRHPNVFACGNHNPASNDTNALSAAARGEIGAHVRECWTKDAGADGVDKLSVVLHVVTDAAGTTRIANVADEDQAKMSDPVFQAFAERAGLVLVIGAANSSNSVRLKEVAERSGAGAAQLIASADDIDWRWFDGVTTLGLTVASVLVALCRPLRGGTDCAEGKDR